MANLDAAGGGQFSNASSFPKKINGREEAERDCAREFEEILTRADEVTVGEEKHGMRSFSFTFRLDKDHSAMSDQLNNTSWWERWSLRLKRFTKRRTETK